MGRRQIPQMYDGQLLLPDTADTGLRSIRVESHAWYEWLNQPSTASFGYRSAHGSFTARREQRQGAWYWYAYRTHGGTLRKAYLGKPADLTIQRLNAVAERLAAQQAASPPGSGRHPPSLPPSMTFPDAILSTKLLIPHTRPDLVPRPHLIERLEAGLARALTVVCAPAGFGKTTLLSDWLRHRRHAPVEQGPPHAAWLSLDAADNDPAHFMRHFIAALRTIAPSVGATALPLLESPHPAPLHALLISAINDIAALQQTCLLVLDDYHVLHTAAIHEAMALLLERLPPQLRLVISSRTVPSLPLARLRARQELNELRLTDLRFTLNEATAFLNDGMGLRLSPGETAELEQRTEGWIAGLQLVALSLKDRTDTSDFIATFTGGNRFIADYLMDEVLARQPAVVQNFLLRTSILNQLCAPLCDAVLGWHRSADLLKQAEQANLFLNPLDPDRHWYAYHSLFADALRHHLQQAHRHEIAELHERARVWYEREGLTAEAIHHALMAEDYWSTARLIEQSTESLWMHGEARTLQRWLEALPREIMHAEPRLLLTKAWTHFALEPNAAAAPSALLLDVEAILDGEQQQGTLARISNPELEVAELRGIVAAIRAAISSMQPEQHQRTIACAEEALACLPRQNVFWRLVAAANLGIAYVARGETTSAAAALTEAKRLALGTSNRYMAQVVLRQLAAVRQRCGQLQLAAELYREGLAIAARHGQGQSYHVRYLYLGLAKLLYEWNDLEGAARQLAEGLDKPARAEEQPLLALMEYATLASIKHAQGDLVGARTLIRQGEEAARQPSMPWAEPLVHAYLARLWLMDGQLEQAGGWLGEVASAFDDTFSLRQEMVQVTRARVLIALDRAGDALLVLEQLKHAAEAARRLGSVVEVLILRACALEAQGNTPDALVALEQALGLAHPAGYVRSFLDEGMLMAGLLHRAASQRIAPMYVSTLLSAFGNAPPSRDRAHPRTLAQRRAGLLREREHEVLSLVARGLSNREIADQLVVALSTVKWYINTIYGKLGVHRRTQAVARAKDMGLL